ncbi:hypothetical protein [Ancylobacter terrae]|uniref:hypothetical protein n=1 Tax=Ancylobacter sp. sgz301288 TaxID=3342077 RepID=UPI00385B4E82
MNTYVRPQEDPYAGADLLDLASALRDFSPVLSQAFQNVERKQQESAQAAVAQSTEEELQAHVRAGTAPPTVTGAGQKAYSKLAAQQLAIGRLGKLQAAWDSGEFDRDNGDFGAFIANAAKEDLANIQDPDAKNAYGAFINKFSGKLKADATSYKVQQVKGNALNMVGDTWFAALTAGISEGKSPQELQAAIRGQYAGFKSTLNLSPQELDTALLGVTRRLAETPGSEAYIEHFLNDTRGGVGSIAAKADSVTSSQTIINRAQAVTRQHQTEQLRLQNKANADRDQAMVDGRVEMAAENGTLAFMTPVEVRTESGGAKMVSADEQQKAGVEAIRKKAEAMAEQGNPGAAMDYRIGALNKNGLVDPQWTSVLKAGPSAATHEALEKGQVPPALKSGIALYETLYARNPRLLAKHVGESEQFFYEAYRVARQDMGYDEAGSLAAAVRFTDTANPQEIPQSLRQDFLKLREGLAKLRAGTWEWMSPSSWWLPGVSGNGIGAVTVTDDVARKMERWGEFYVRLGKPPEEALEMAVSRVRDVHTVINGTPVPTNDRTTPPNFKDMATWKLKQWARTYGATYGLDAKDLTVRASGDGQQGAWSIWRKDGSPVMVMEEDARNALSFSLRGAREEFEAAERDRIIREQSPEVKAERLKKSQDDLWSRGGSRR